MTSTLAYITHSYTHIVAYL